MPRSLPAGDSTVIMHGAMSELQNVQHLLEEAKRAADAGDLAAADALLRDVVRIQESELGAVHPELANTVNNLAVVAEMDRRLPDAEAYYRRALAIGSASLAADDPVLVSSRKNLEDFCREHGLPFDSAGSAVAVTEAADHPLEPVAADHTIVETKSPLPVEVTAAVPAPASAPSVQIPPMADSTVRDVDASSVPAAASRRPLAIVVIALVALVAATLLVMRPWSARQPPTSGQAVEPAALPAAEPAPPRPTTAAPTATAQPPAAASRDNGPGAAATSAPNPARSTGGMTLVTSQLCRTLSTGHNWLCEPADQSVTPGPLILYTRVKSSRDGVVIHQWYRGNTLRKSARLPVQANTTDGYRTYSRQTVNRGEDWRVEVRTTAGDLLYEQRVSVR